MHIYNSLTRKVEELNLDPSKSVGIYTCGPTVYSTATIGNFRTYVTSDLLVRSLEYMGYKTKSVMNITDVGHLTGDNEGDSSIGEDRLEKASARENKSAFEIARELTGEFVVHMALLNIQKPEVMPKATEHISEQIELIRRIEEKGFTYKTSDGIYFDTKKYESLGGRYGELSTLDEIREGARVESNPEKRDPRDFALWKFSMGPERRQMEWDSPWGVGFPGWHIECSAMSMKYLGTQFDIHVGGEDLRSTHHPNEIVQSEAATGRRPFVRYWVHGAFLLVDGGRMGKSLGNAYTLNDILHRNYDPLALRYLYLTGHYRKQLNFTFDSLSSSQSALKKIRKSYQNFLMEKERTVLSEEKLGKVDQFRAEFMASLSNDLDMPQALSVLWSVVKSNIPGRDKADLMIEMDRVLGLSIDKKIEDEIPEEIEELAKMRLEARRSGDYDKSDKLRDQIRQGGYEIMDVDDGYEIEKI